jgi:hypothetical protein
MKHLQYEFMDFHDEIAKDVFLTRYSDGSEVVSNYSGKAFRCKGEDDPSDGLQADQTSVSRIVLRGCGINRTAGRGKRATMNDQTKARDTVMKGLTLATGISLIGMAAAAGQDHSKGADAFVELANKQVSVRFDAASGAVASVSNRVLGIAYTIDAPAPSCLN